MKNYAFGALYIFRSSYLCKQVFSSMSYIKSKHRSCLTRESLQSCVTIEVTHYSHDIEKIHGDVQKQTLH